MRVTWLVPLIPNRKRLLTRDDSGEELSWLFAYRPNLGMLCSELCPERWSGALSYPYKLMRSGWLEFDKWHKGFITAFVHMKSMDKGIVAPLTLHHLSAFSFTHAAFRVLSARFSIATCYTTQPT